MGHPGTQSLTVRSGVSGSLTAFRQPGYTVEIDPRLILTAENYYDSKARMPEGTRMSTAGEELAIQLALERAGEDPRNAAVFEDLFARGPNKTYVWQWTETGLRVPPGTQPDYFITDTNGNKYWPRTVLIGDKEVGALLVPEGRGRVVTKWNEAFGLPAKTEQPDFPHKPYTTHFGFNQNPQKDEKSGHHDVAVGRGGWRHGGVVRCLGVDADCGRWDAGSGDGFRPVRGSLPEIERRQISLGQDAVEKALADVQGSG